MGDVYKRQGYNITLLITCAYLCLLMLRQK